MTCGPPAGCTRRRDESACPRVAPRTPGLPRAGAGPGHVPPQHLRRTGLRGPEGRSTSRPNIFGGYDTEGPGKGRSSSQPNIFHGEDIRTRDGTIQSQPNIFGGETYRLPDGGRVESAPNIFGGRDYRYPDGRKVTCRPNIFGGEDSPVTSAGAVGPGPVVAFCLLSSASARNNMDGSPGHRTRLITKPPQGRRRSLAGSNRAEEHEDVRDGHDRNGLRRSASNLCSEMPPLGGANTCGLAPSCGRLQPLHGAAYRTAA